MEEEKKVIIKLTKEPLASERKEMREKRKHKVLIILLCVFLFLSGLGIGYGLTYIKMGSYYLSHKNNKFDEIKDYMKNVWLYKNDYEDLDTVLEDKAFYGMTKFEDDPYTTYMSKEENNSFISSLNMNYVGIGVQYYQHNGTATITRVFKESPAENAGIKVGDIMKKVNGEAVDNLTSDEIKNMVVGQEGTTVDITVDRNGEEKTLTVVRGSVDSTVYVETYEDIVILDIMSFGEDTANECIKYLDDYKDYSKLIIDLRDNSGGLQASVENIAGLFLGEDVVYMIQTFSNGQVEQAKTKANAYYDNFKDIVILTNESTASAAEVLTMCLKEQHDNVTTVGTKTYGKGVVQSRYLLNDDSTIKITTSAWSSPSGVSINGKGIVPDEEVRYDDIFYMVVPQMEDDDVYKYDSVSNYVLIAEKSLRFLGYTCDRDDGYFDNSFTNALDKFKEDNNFEINHVLDKQTYDEIIDEISYIYSTDINKDPQLTRAKEILK